jgi:hypothetical protein
LVLSFGRVASSAPLEDLREQRREAQVPAYAKLPGSLRAAHLRPTDLPFIVRESDVQSGTVKWFNATKCYGFIAPDGGGGLPFRNKGTLERLFQDSPLRFRARRSGSDQDREAKDDRVSLRALNFSTGSNADQFRSFPLSVFGIWSRLCFNQWRTLWNGTVPPRLCDHEAVLL